jgi:hypothetical protein
MGTMTACLWCGSKFAPRATGGSPQEFCSSDHRNEFHRTSRLWTEKAIRARILTIADLKGDPTAFKLKNSVDSPKPKVKPIKPDTQPSQRERAIRLKASAVWDLPEDELEKLPFEVKALLLYIDENIRDRPKA